ncbi:MAG: tape measure protein [Gammaproteobacteria bacterium]|nr:tape measure protein [Gammaproteobacteria bacterium]
MLAKLASDLVAASSNIQALNSRLMALTDGASGFADAQNFLSQSAQDLSQDINVMRGSYASFLTLADSGIITIGDAKSLTLGFADAASRLATEQSQLKNVNYGLSQALSSGVVRAEELNQVMEPMPGLMGAVERASGLAAGQLRRMVNDGKMTSEMFKNMLIVGLREFEGAARDAAGDIGPTFIRLKNSYTMLLETFEKPVGAAIVPVLNEVTGMLEKAQNAAKSWNLDGSGITAFFSAFHDGGAAAEFF